MRSNLPKPELYGSHLGGSWSTFPIGWVEPNPGSWRTVKTWALIRELQLVRIGVQAISDEVNRMLKGSKRIFSKRAIYSLVMAEALNLKKDIERCHMTLPLQAARVRLRLWAQAYQEAQSLIAADHQLCTDQTYVDRSPSREQSVEHPWRKYTIVSNRVASPQRILTATASFH
jgi:hypothetical protein